MIDRTKPGNAWRPAMRPKPERAAHEYVAPTAVRSLRMKQELWDYVAERADKRRISPNAWVALMIELHKAGKLKEEK